MPHDKTRRLSLRGLLEIAGCLLALATLTPFWGHWWWVLDLTSHFRVQYAVLLTALGAGFAWAGMRRNALVLAGLALLNAVLVLPHAVFADSSGEVAGDFVRHGNEPALKVLQVNVHTGNPRADLFLEYVGKENPEVLVMEEVDLRWMERMEPLRGNYPQQIKEPRDDNFGIALLSRLPLHDPRILDLGDAEVPSVSAEIEVRGRRIRIVGTHPLPPVSSEYSRLRDSQLAELARHLQALDGPVILVGDLNTTPGSWSFWNLVRDSGLRDTGRGQGFQPTWPSGAWPLRIAIDHCLVSPQISVRSRKVGPWIGSDHLPLVLELVLR